MAMTHKTSTAGNRTPGNSTPLRDVLDGPRLPRPEHANLSPFERTPHPTARRGARAPHGVTSRAFG